jgi:phytoene synthase
MSDIDSTIRSRDEDRYFAALFAPAEKRGDLFALYALNHELARVAETVREPMMGAIRLQWWRETIEGARAGKPREHPVARALTELFKHHDLPQSLFDAMIDAREMDTAAHIFLDLAGLENYADATSGNLMRLAARVLGSVEDDLAREAGIAFALTGILRAVPFHAARGKVYLPDNLLRAAGTSQADLIATHSGKKLAPVIARMAEAARDHLAKARAFRPPKKTLAAFLPATTAPLYLKRVTRSGFDAFRDEVDVPLFRRQYAMLRASWRHRL